MGSRKLRLPDDDYKHEAIVEWWYFNGFLKVGRKNYAFMNCLFKIDPVKANIPIISKLMGSFGLREGYFAHSILYDLSMAEKKTVIIPITFISKNSFEGKRLSVSYIRPMVGGFGVHLIERLGENLRIKNDFVDLLMNSRRDAIIQGKNGWVSLPGVGGTWYYSYSDLRVEGELLGKKCEGTSWMDHQWADVSYSPALGWDWFSIKLDHGTDIICYKFIFRDNAVHRAYISEPDGETREIPFEYVALEQWESSVTGAVYDIAWLLSFPTENLKLRVSSFMRDQELLFGAINYWEGPVKVFGNWNGKRISGKGFVELVGRRRKANLLRIGGYELKKTVKESFDKLKTILLRKNFR